MRLIGGGPKSLVAILIISRPVPMKEPHLRVTFEGQNMGGDAIEEPTIMTDDQGRAAE